MEVTPALSKIAIYRGWCKRCGICVAFCPHQALAEDEDSYPFLKESAKCNRCGLCEMRCPDFAIVVTEDEESDAEKSSSSR